MPRYRLSIAFFAAACGGGGSHTATAPDHTSAPTDSARPSSEPASEAAHDAKRDAGVLTIVPPGSNCLPTKLKEDSSLQLELASVGKDPILCAVDTDATRLAGSVGCWKVDLPKMGANSVPLVYRPAAPLPNHNVDAALVDRCARGFCLPEDAKLGDASVAHLSWNNDASKVAVLVGDDLHLFEASTKAHRSSFSIRGDKGVPSEAVAVAVYLVGSTAFVVGAEKGVRTGVWGFRSNGNQLGAINALGGKAKTPVSPNRGAFSVLDPGHVAIADHGMETLTTYEVETGKRTKSVRKLPKSPCKADESEAFWREAKVGKKCKAALESDFGVFIGATAIMGSTNLLVALQGERLGELAVIDPKSLAEHRKPLKMPWCEGK